jgi:hypothetical protein
MQIQTGACICISGQRDRAFITFRGAVNEFNSTQIDLNELYSSQAVHIAGKRSLFTSSMELSWVDSWHCSWRCLETMLKLRFGVLRVVGFFNCPGLWPALPEILRECRARGILTILTPQFDATEVCASFI